MKFNIWLEKQLEGQIPKEVIAFNFNLYECEAENQFDVQLIGCKKYDLENDDWACDPDYTSGEDLYHFFADGWETALKSFVALVKDYLRSCCTPNQFTSADCISAGFVDGDLEIIYHK